MVRADTDHGQAPLVVSAPPALETCGGSLVVLFYRQKLRVNGRLILAASPSMKSRIYSLLNIKPAEAGVVKQLFLVQFFLGVATSFVFTSALTLFLATYPIKELPNVLLLAAGLLLVANYLYARLEAKLSAKKLLQVIILFSLGSIAFTWLEATFFAITWLPFRRAVLLNRGV